ncbi:Adenylate cyclase [Acidisarcina polymorpha]|uniref:Adenylate cyclase n=1 Tax=Acidisarcina polymorpha TaxID=2211140 RepID=A0A2Z5FX98_9BACT|nr:hypothetical protein [Acidisarcina polymorpha]AXC11402.1 Adenylate cyclase [Acidisarcina polymorpha]
MQTLEPTSKAAAGFRPRSADAADPRSPNAADQGPHLSADDQRWQLALRIAASRSLGRSQLLSDFLLYIVERSIQGRRGEITEQQIGVAVFGRAEDYNSNDDNIVRSYARKLRQRIDNYYASEGSEETLRLEIPRGGYAPTFTDHVSPPAIAEEPSRDGDPEGLEPRKGEEGDEPRSARAAGIMPSVPIIPRRAFTPGTLVVLLLGILLGVGAMQLKQSRIFVSRAEATSHTLWAELFSGNRDTFIVPSDAGLVIMQRLIDRPVPLSNYVSGTYRTKLKADDLPNAAEILKLGNRRYTSVVDLDLAAHLAQLHEVVPGRMLLRYARDLRMDDLRTGNAILIGSDESNPWIQLFGPQLQFSFHYDPNSDQPSGFVNPSPRPGESELYTTSGQEDRTFGIIAYRPNLAGTGHVLIVAGLNTAGTQAAADFLLDPSSMMPTLRRSKLADGTLQPFELLVSAGNVATNASTPHLVLERLGLPASH